MSESEIFKKNGVILVFTVLPSAKRGALEMRAKSALARRGTLLVVRKGPRPLLARSRYGAKRQAYTFQKSEFTVSGRTPLRLAAYA